MSDDRGRPANRLADSSSPYLLLHKHNPVDWYPWGREALERARREEKPIFVSVGYSTCYWCHVMERESFTDEGVAALMNREFVNIKLDREERPDLDEIYMTATQILTGQGGWPNSVFLTPKLEPYFAGTYFPPEDRSGLPSFRTVLTSMADAWASRRGDVEKQAKSVADAIRHHLGDRPGPAVELPGPDVVERSLAALSRSFDPEWGGFGGAPKFPSPSNLLFLEGLAGADGTAAEMLSATLDQMARGGIYDQLGGGFHRYATDREWRIPHFEKMLYDNGWLLELYAREHERTGDPQAARVVRRTAGFLAREMTSAEGALWSALDAETNGEEGAFYVWTRQDLLGILAEEDFGFLAPLLGFAGPPFFEGDRYVLHLPERLEAQAERRRMEPDTLIAEIEPLGAKLMKARSARRRPLTDDKVLTDWNGSAIAGLAEAGRALNEPALTSQATAAATFVLENMSPDGELHHAWREGVAHTPAMLADYAYFVRGLLALHRATGDDAWLESAGNLTRKQKERLSDGEGGFYVAPEDENLLVRSRDLFDGATPAPNAVAVLNLLDLAALDPTGGWSGEAERALKAFAPVVTRVPEATRTLALAVQRLGSAAERGASEPVVPLAPAAGRSNEISARLELSAGGGFVLMLQIKDGWHVYAPAASDDRGVAVQALTISVSDADLLDLELPSAESLAVPELPKGEHEGPLVYSGAVEITGRVGLTGPDPRLLVSFQACDDRRCLAPETIVLKLGSPT